MELSVLRPRRRAFGTIPAVSVCWARIHAVEKEKAEHMRSVRFE